MTQPNQTENNFVYKVISGISNYEIKKKGNKEKTTFNFFLLGSSVYDIKLMFVVKTIC